MNFAGGIGEHDCAVCRAYPGHTGKHYTIRAISVRCRGARLKSLGRTKWVELAGCKSADGHSILATVHMTRHPKARNVAPGRWLCEKTPDFDPEEKMPSPWSDEDVLPLEQAEGEDEQQAILEVVEQADTAPDETGGSSQEERLMADADKVGYLAWSDGDLAVEIQPVPNSKQKPDVAALKNALNGFEPPDGVLVTLTETLGGQGGWVALAAPAGSQGQLLISAGTVIQRLVEAGVYDEVLLSNNR